MLNSSICLTQFKFAWPSSTLITRVVHITEWIALRALHTRNRKCYALCEIAYYFVSVITTFECLETTIVNKYQTKNYKYSFYYFFWSKLNPINTWNFIIIQYVIISIYAQITDRQKTVWNKVPHCFYHQSGNNITYANGNHLLIICANIAKYILYLK